MEYKAIDAVLARYEELVEQYRAEKEKKKRESQSE